MTISIYLAITLAFSMMLFGMLLGIAWSRYEKKVAGKPVTAQMVDDVWQMNIDGPLINEESRKRRVVWGPTRDLGK